MNRVNGYTRFIYMNMVKTWNIGPDNNDFVETETRSFATKIMKCIFFFQEKFFAILLSNCPITYVTQGTMQHVPKRMQPPCFDINKIARFLPFSARAIRAGDGEALTLWLKRLLCQRSFFQPCPHQGNGLRRKDKASHC